MSEYPKFLYSRELHKLYVAQNLADERSLLEKWGFRPIEIYRPLEYPKRAFNSQTGEERQINDRFEDEHLSTNWIDGDHRLNPHHDFATGRLKSA